MPMPKFLEAASPLADIIGGGAKAISPLLGSLQEGGRVQKTGPYKLHKGEHVIPAKSRRRMSSRERAFTRR